MYFPEQYGKTLIPAIIDILAARHVTADGAGGTVPSNLFTVHEAVNKDNVRDVTIPTRSPASHGPTTVEASRRALTFALHG